MKESSRVRLYLCVPDMNKKNDILIRVLLGKRYSNVSCAIRHLFQSSLHPSKAKLPLRAAQRRKY